jgi:hypothetical protein
MSNVSIVAKRATILLTAHSQEKMKMNSQTWFPKRIPKPIPILIEGNVDRKGQTSKKTPKAMMILWT